MALTRKRTSRAGVPRFTYGTSIIRVSSTPAKDATSSSTAAYTAARIESLRQTRDRAALSDLQAGKLIPFIEYATSTMDERTGDERTRWEKLLEDTSLMRDEKTMQAAVNAGDIPLERYLDFLNARRNHIDTTDTMYADLTSQIADVKNAIEARDFNAELVSAQAAMIDAGSTTAAKQTYLKVLVGAYTRAKDPTAQKALSTQITQMRDEIQKDIVLKRSQEDNMYLIRYYTPGGGVSGTEALAYLAERAATAESPAEANRYASLALQIATRERTLTTQRLRAAASGGGGGGGSGGGSPSLATVAAEIKAETTSAISNLDRSVRSGRPDDRALMLAREATDRELNAIDAALPAATPSAARTLLARRDAAETDFQTSQRSGALKLVALEADANTIFNQNLTELRASGASAEEIARAIAARVGQITLRRSSSFFDDLDNDPQTAGELAKMETTTRNKLTGDAQDAARVLVGNDSALTKKIDAEYLRYRTSFTAQGKQPPVGVDEWMRIMSGNLDDAAAATKLGISAKGSDIEGVRVERDNVRRLNAERQAEVNSATDQYVASAWPRNEQTGQRYPYAPSPAAPNMPGTGVQPGPNASPMEQLAFMRTWDPFEASYFQQERMRNGGAPATDQQVGSPDEVAPPEGNGPLTGRSGPMAQRMNADPHVAADMFLDTPSTFMLPTWEIPSLPAFSPFAPSFDPGDLEDFAPPPLPTFYPMPIADALPTATMPALTQGNIEAPPTYQGASTSGEATGGPTLTP